MKERLDNIFIGMLAAIIVPIIIWSLYAASARQYGNLAMLYNMMMDRPEIRLQVLTIGIIPNMFLFYIVNNRLQMYEFTRGFVIITVLMGLAAIIWTQLL
jgi:hypothetical protein